MTLSHCDEVSSHHALVLCFDTRLHSRNMGAVWWSGHSTAFSRVLDPNYDALNLSTRGHVCYLVKLVARAMRNSRYFRRFGVEMSGGWFLRSDWNFVCRIKLRKHDVFGSDLLTI